MKKNITREEYENAIERIDFIYREKELLECMSRNKIYNAHIDLPGTFGELLINIIRENKNINNLINELENSILRRKKLLSNENYVNKAPKELVEKEKQTLEEEIKKLEVLKG